MRLCTERRIRLASFDRRVWTTRPSGSSHAWRRGGLLLACVALVVAIGGIPAPPAHAAEPSGGLQALLALQQAQLTVAGGGAHDWFGCSVALEGDTALVGAAFVDIGSNVDQGCAYVFVRSSGMWTQQAQLVAGDGGAYDEFGQSVALSGDTALVGAANHDVGAHSDQGCAYVFVRSGESWSLQQQLAAADGATQDWFGCSVAVEGDTALIGVMSDYIGASYRQGSARIFMRSGTTWSEQQTLIGSTCRAADYFGSSVALSGDTALVGAPDHQVGEDPRRGAAYVFVRSGLAWTEQQELTPAEQRVNYRFGQAVALDGESAAIGAGGAAHVFVRSGTTWSQQQKLVPVDVQSTNIGRSVAVDGDTIILGSVDPGKAYLFSRSEGSWTQRQRLAGGYPTTLGDSFGRSVALSGDTILVGADQSTVEGVSQQGSVYVFVSSMVSDAAAPVSTVALEPLPNALGWSRQPVSVDLTATDDFPGVQGIYYRVGDSGGYGEYSLVAKPFFESDGIFRVWYYAQDEVGNQEVPRSVTVRIDTGRPVTKALANAAVLRYRKATLRLRVNDKVSPKATVVVKITKRGVLKKTLNLGVRSTNTEIRYSFTCGLARGSYIWKVYATDRAGNTQASPAGYKTLVVK